eukprot:2836346-Rhodomonas_salina.2
MSELSRSRREGAVGSYAYEHTAEDASVSSDAEERSVCGYQAMRRSTVCMGTKLCVGAWVPSYA